MADYYEIVQPFEYGTAEESKNSTVRVGVMFPIKDKETGRIKGFNIKFNASPPYPERLMAFEPRPKEDTKGKSSKQKVDEDIPF